MSVRYLTEAEVIEVHDAEIAVSGGLPGIMNPQNLAAAVARPQQGFGDLELYPTLAAKAAALFESLVRNHGFCDGNKRTAVVVTTMFLTLNGVKLTADQDEMVTLAVQTAKGELSFERLTQRLEAYSAQLEFLK